MSTIDHFKIRIDDIPPFFILPLTLVFVHWSNLSLNISLKPFPLLIKKRQQRVEYLSYVIKLHCSPSCLLLSHQIIKNYHFVLIIIYNKNMTSQQTQKRGKKRIVGSFQLGRTIGKGTFATVKEAIHLPTNQKVALKILHKRMIVDQRDKTNISRQLRIIKKIRHPNIVQLLQIIQTNSKIYIAMEHIRGGQLYELIVNSEKSRLTEEKASVYFQQLINTVQYLHSLGITHRDLKPENIMIGEDDIIKLIDFGLSNLYGDQEKLSTPCGSPCYAAPEMISRKEYSPLKANLWSCGIVLYTMLCGFLPFEHENTAQLYKLAEKGIYEQPDHLSPLAKDILKKLLEADPDKRMSLAQIRHQPFCKQHKQPIIKGLLPSEKIVVDIVLVEELKSLGYSGFMKDIEDNAINQNTTAYYLILFRMLTLDKISHLTYYQSLIQIKSQFKSQSFLIKKYENPEELPQINKKNILSLVNMTKIKRQRDTRKRNMSLKSFTPMVSSKSGNLRIKKVVKQR